MGGLTAHPQGECMFFVLKIKIKYFINELAMKIIIKSDDKYFQYNIVSNYIYKYPEDQEFINEMFKLRRKGDN